MGFWGCFALVWVAARRFSRMSFLIAELEIREENGREIQRD